MIKHDVAQGHSIRHSDVHDEVVGPGDVEHLQHTAGGSEGVKQRIHTALAVIGEAHADHRLNRGAELCRIEIDAQPDRTHVEIVTTSPDACADCIVPESIMRMYLEPALGVSGDALEITYPEESAAPSGAE